MNISLVNDEAESFALFLSYLHTGRVDLASLSRDAVFDLLSIAKFVGNDELVKLIRSYFDNAYSTRPISSESSTSSTTTTTTRHDTNVQTVDLLASGSSDRSIRLWHAASGECVRTIANAHDGDVNALQVSGRQQHTLIISAGNDGLVKIWRLLTGECVRTLRADADFVLAIELLATDDGFEELLATGSFDTVVKIWSVTSGAHVRNLTGHTDCVTSLKWLGSRTGLLLTGSADLSIRVWHVASGACVRTMLGHTDLIASIELVGRGEVVIK